MRSDSIKFLTPQFSFLIALGIGACGEPGDTRAGADSRAGIDSPGVLLADRSKPGAPCPAGASYTVRDTLTWATMIEEGKRAVLRADATIVDRSTSCLACTPRTRLARLPPRPRV